MFGWLGVGFCVFFFNIGLSQSHVTDRELRGFIWVDHDIFFLIDFFFIFII